MRWYEITITDPAQPSVAPQVYTSWVNGQNDPGALNVNFDFNVAPYSTPLGAHTVEIWGIPLKSISWATNLTYKNVSIKAGFKPGLPLATVASRYQSGPIINGFILQSFGNWIGNNMTLNLIIASGPAPVLAASPTTAGQAASTASASAQPPLGSPETPVNFTLDMPQGMTMATALENSLSAALPSFTRKINIRDIIAPRGLYETARSISELAQKVKQISKEIIGGDYTGVEIGQIGGNRTIRVYDGSNPGQVKQIDFKDLIGQPTWIEPFKIQFKCPMRADLDIGDIIEMPKNETAGFYGVMPNNALSIANYRNQSAQLGTYYIDTLRHVGNFRQPDANSWATIVTCGKFRGRT